ncbi:MAG: FeoA family protein [Myxococcota bacterium]
MTDIGRARGLDRLPLHEPARITEVLGDGAVLVQLLEMGFVRGTEVEVIKRAPLGDPIELRLRGYHVSVRAQEARHVLVELLK